MQYPAGQVNRYSTQVSRFLDGSEQRYPEFGTAIRYWIVSLDHLTDGETRALQSFHTMQQGRTGSFPFTDPWDGTVYPDCSFAGDEYAVATADDDQSNLKLTIRNNRT
jgi:hypothetical protein